MPLKFPSIYLLNSHFEKEQAELHDLERQIGVVWKVEEADVVIGRVGTASRAALELRKLGIHTEPFVRPAEPNTIGRGSSRLSPRPRKRRKVAKSVDDDEDIIPLDSSTESESEAENSGKEDHGKRSASTRGTATSETNLKESESLLSSQTVDDSKTLKVLKLDWYLDSLKAGALLPTNDKRYLVYEGKIVVKTAVPARKVMALPPQKKSSSYTHPRDIPAREATSTKGFKGDKSIRSSSQSKTRPIHLLRETTSEHDRDSRIPPIPDYLHTRYCCQRPTFLNSPNDTFIAQLKIIRHARELESNEVIGHDFSAKAYSGAIATLSSYPHTITTTKELQRLPNIADKITGLWQEWKENGSIEEVEQIEKDERMKCLHLFYGIYDVGEATAREFYAKGWRTLDDIIVHGWSSLTRDQQIGLKYYEELQLRIPRDEVERTGQVVLQFANKIQPGFQMSIVGGYRRGKADCGDMDFILTHPDSRATAGFLPEILDNLVRDRWVTHELTVSNTNSRRGQETLGWRGATRRPKGGFDTLDHAFVVWQDIHFPSNLSTNPNPHRRVDIIISPWKTAGCAIVGWTGGTMFERDLRSYTRHELGLKFDSSGVRRLINGEWIDLEGDVKTLDGKERKVFEGLGLTWREPTERCTH